MSWCLIRQLVISAIRNYKYMILILNIGSTSIKFGLYDTNEREINRGVFEYDQDIATSFKEVLREIGNLDLIEAVGHRVVHGAERYTEPTELTSEIIEDLEDLSELAPLHNPYNLKGITAARKWLPDVPHYAVFDTAFFSDLPQRSQMCPIAFSYYEKGIKRYGFHGLSHQYIMEETAKQLGKDVDKLTIITCHLGGGASITAIEKGKPIDTSMGFTPQEGLMMMTRPGDIDPGLLVHLSKTGVDIEDVITHNGGFKGMLHTTDYKEVIENVKKNLPHAVIAFELYLYRIVKYIGSYSAVLNTVDAVVFSGAIGSGDPFTVDSLKKKYPFIKSQKILTIPTNEEVSIARRVIECL